MVLTSVLSAGSEPKQAGRIKGRGHSLGSIPRSNRSSIEESFERSFLVSFQKSFVVSFQGSFDRSNVKCDEGSFAMRAEGSDDRCIGRCFEESFAMSFRMRNVESFDQSFRMSFRESFRRNFLVSSCGSDDCLVSASIPESGSGSTDWRIPIPEYQFRRAYDGVCDGRDRSSGGPAMSPVRPGPSVRIL